MPFQSNTAQTCRYPRLFFVSGHGTTVPARDNSPSFQEGVPEGRGSNIGIRIPCDNWQRHENSSLVLPPTKTPMNPLSIFKQKSSVTTKKGSLFDSP